MVFGSITTIGQTIECQAKDRTDSPPPIGYRNQPLSAMDWKCVKVKFHILDNDGLPITDQQIYDRLQEINRYFEPGNIRLVLYDACIQRLQISENVTDIDITNSLQSGSSLYEYDSSALNIYVLNSTQPGACSFAKAIYDNTVSFRYSFHCSWNHSPEVFAHEIGHVIGNLGHTFAVETKIDSITGELTYLNVECKDRTNCQTAGDYICQTGADPYAMDLNDNNIPDVFDDTLHVDTSSCQQILTNEPGECMPYDSSTYWDIPFRNLMSYYNNCYEEFVEEQYLEMHMKLDNDPEVSNFIIDCDDLDIQNPQTNVQDIIIDDVVLWSNMNVELYPNQNIVITDNGFLTLNNTKLTLIGTNAYNTFCSSDINDYWGGILIEGGDAGGSIAQGPGGDSSINCVWVHNFLFQLR